MIKKKLYFLFIALFSFVLIFWVLWGLITFPIGLYDLAYELGCWEMQQTNVQFQNYDVEEKRLGKKMGYNAILTTTGFEKKQVKISVNINLDEYIALDPKYASTRIEKDEKRLESTAGYISSDFRKALQETKALRYTKKGDTLSVHHSGNIGYPYKIENITQKTFIVLEQEPDRLLKSLIFLGVSLFFIYFSIFSIYIIFIAKKQSIIQQNNKTTL